MRTLILDNKHPAQAEAGGAQLYMLRLAQVLLRSQHEVTYFTSSAPDVRRVVDACGIDFRRAGNRYTVFRHAREFLRQRRNDFDLVIDSVNQRSFAPHTIVGRERAISIVHHLGREAWTTEFHPPFSWLGRYVAEPYFVRELRGARLVAVSESTASDLRSVGLAVAAIVPPAHDAPVVSRQGPPDLAHPRIVFVGRLVNDKRPFLALRAFQLLRERFEHATLDVLGDGYLRASIQDAAAPGVTVHGYVDDVEKSRFLAESTLLLVTSLREGWGIVVSEAGAHGVPVVGVDRPGLRDSIVDGVTGLLTQDSPEAMSHAAAALLRNADRWARMSCAAVERSRASTWEGCARQILDCAGKEYAADDTSVELNGRGAWGLVGARAGGDQ
jgi:glycosyltransferase involved in cell wall biosynthesis